MSKFLVVYFSASGITREVSKRLAEKMEASLFEIQPQQSYSRADLNWNDSESRSSLEMKDPNSRPAIKNQVQNMDQYDVIFIGFPIWWYREPSIIDTFMESYDFSGKTIVPFATSGGSGMGNSSQNLQKLAPNADVKEGKRFGSRVSGTELAKWAAAYL
ncbi:NAD(P)H-dependent oxidoreductase [Faecalicoccus pleomorphus]|uniref:flavodoxin n=1 Tax=Faecalicoccus pleomorphus TaxID=1323 RepID=UPI0019603D71|nr:flavodoxin [Faecalicoccus pleomorphus]MBM6765690.1 NAD(P)H-dependent oxidoreductase [Faecalicoccus pleomorphus]